VVAILSHYALGDSAVERRAGAGRAGKEKTTEVEGRTGSVTQYMLSWGLILGMKHISKLFLSVLGGDNL